MSSEIGPIRRFYNRETGKSFVAAVDSSNDVITAELDENGKPINAQNRIPREEYNEILKDEKIEADTNTAVLPGVIGNNTFQTIISGNIGSTDSIIGVVLT